jgi:hypothetical protein
MAGTWSDDSMVHLQAAASGWQVVSRRGTYCSVSNARFLIVIARLDRAIQ